MQHSRTPLVGSVLLAVLAAISCLAYITSTVTVTRSTFTWDAGRTGDPAGLVLSAQSPQTLTLSGPCPAVREPASDVLLTGDPGTSLTLRAERDSLWMEYAGLPIGDSLRAEPGCDLTLTYGRDGNTAELTVGDQSTVAEVVVAKPDSAELPYRQFAVTKLWAAPGLTAEVVTQPTTFSSSPWRVVWIVLGLGALVGLAVLLRRTHPPARALRSPAARFAVQDAVVAVAGLVALFVVPPRFDDGWVLTTVRQYDDLGFFSNYYSIDAAAQPQGFWWTWIERLWLDPMWTPGFLLRLPTILILIGTWWFVRRHILAACGCGQAAVWAASVVTIAGLIGLQVTIRPEPMIAALVAAAIAVVVQYARSPQPHLLVVLASLSAFGLAAHQTGWSVITASAAVLPWAWSWLRQRRSWPVAGAILVTAGSTFLLASMLGSNLTLWRRSVASFRSDSTTYQSFLDEGDRVAGLAMRPDHPSITILAVALIGLAVLGFLLRGSPGDSSVKAAGWASVAAIGGLLLTTSKLVDHYGAVLPATVVLVALTISSLRPAVAVGAVLAVAVTAVASFLGGGVWALGVERATLFQAGSWPVVATVVMALIVVVVFVRRATPAGSVTAATAGAVSLACVLSITPVVIEGVQQPGTWFGQQVAALQGRTCGAVDAITVRKPPPATFDQPVTGIQPVGPDTTVWARSPLFTPIRLTAVTTDEQRQTITLPSSAVSWAQVPLPSDSKEIEINQRGLRVVTATGLPSQPAAAVAAAAPDNWWVEPGLALQAPCVRATSIAQGVLSDVAWSIGTPVWSGTGLTATASTVYQAGCAGASRTGTGTCVIALDETLPTLEPQVSREGIG